MYLCVCTYKPSVFALAQVDSLELCRGGGKGSRFGAPKPWVVYFVDLVHVAKCIVSKLAFLSIKKLLHVAWNFSLTLRVLGFYLWSYVVWPFVSTLGDEFETSFLWGGVNGSASQWGRWEGEQTLFLGERWPQAATRLCWSFEWSSKSPARR